MAQTIFVAEDDRSINEVVSEYMKDAGFFVLSCAHGGSAGEMIGRSRSIDLFILDIMLPGMSGLELLAAIRASEVHMGRPVIMLTALGDEASQLAGFDALADDYVTKPFSPKVLVRRVKALLRRNGGERGRLAYGSLLINYDSYEVYDCGERVSLTLRETELLGALMASPGRVLTRQQLLNLAWGYDYFGDERIVDVHIKNLRKKLKSNAIFTVKGVGYKLGGGI